MSPFPTGCFTLFDVRQDPTRRPIFLLGNYPLPPSWNGGALLWQRAYVVEGHASACPRTVGVDASMWRWRYRCVVELVVCKVVSTDGKFGVKEKETSVNISGLARKPRKRRIKVKIRPWCVSFSGYILISPEREMECTQLFCALGWIIQCQN